MSWRAYKWKQTHSSRKHCTARRTGTGVCNCITAAYHFALCECLYAGAGAYLAVICAMIVSKHTVGACVWGRLYARNTYLPSVCVAVPPRALEVFYSFARTQRVSALFHCVHWTFCVCVCFVVLVGLCVCVRVCMYVVDVVIASHCSGCARGILRIACAKWTWFSLLSVTNMVHSKNIHCRDFACGTPNT